MSGKASIAILNPLNNEIRAATINIKLNVTLQLSVEKGFILKAKASGIDIDVVAKKVLWDSDERLDTIRAKFKLIQSVLVDAFNESISHGLELPIPANFKNKFRIQNLKFYKNYFLLEFDSEVKED